MKINTNIGMVAVVLLVTLMIIPATRGADKVTQPILVEQKIVQISFNADNRDGIDWDLFKLYQAKRQTTTGFFALDERARHRLDFRAMKKNIPPEQEANSDFENVEQTRVNKFDFGPIWEDTRSPRKITDDTHFGSLKIYNFKNLMEYLRTLGQAKIIFSRKWVTENEQQSMVSSHPELVGYSAPPELIQEYWQGSWQGSWEGSRITFRPEIVENNRIVFSLNSEVATDFYVDPMFHPGLPVMKLGEKEVGRLWRLYRLDTMGVVESGETAIFEDIRDGNGVLIFITPYILESHRKRVD